MLLLHACPACQQPLPVLAYRSRPGHCGVCDASLLEARTPRLADLPAPAVAWQRWVSGQLQRVIVAVQRTAPVTAGDGVARVVATILVERDLTLAKLGSLIGRGKGEVSTWRAGHVVRSMGSLLRLAAVGRLDVAAMLEGRYQQTDLDVPEVIIPTVEWHREADCAMAELLMRRAVEPTNHPPSLRDIEVATAIDGRALRRHNSSLARQVVDHRRAWAAAHRDDRNETRRREAASVMEEYRARGVELTRLQLEAILGYSCVRVPLTSACAAT